MDKLVITGVIVLLTIVGAEGLCSIAEIHTNANKCLMDNMMEQGTDFFIPIVNGSAEVTNFCKRAITDIKHCVHGVISKCASSKKVKSIFGQRGSALLAAYDGICSAEHKEHDMTCVYHGFFDEIKHLISETVSQVDALDVQTVALHDMCMPMHHLHTRVMTMYDEAVMHGMCSEANKQVIHEYLATLMFPCQNVATTYYPCTIHRINSDIMKCYASYGAIVKNGIIPTPASFTHAGEMCADRAKGMIQNCIKNLISKCLYEPQISTIFGATGSPFVAGYDCMCSLDNSDIVLTCASTANISSVMNMYMKSITNHSLNGNLEKSNQCAAEKTLKTELETIIYDTCADPQMRAYWKMYIGTVFFYCTNEPTICYPHNKVNGAESNASLRDMLVLIFTLQVLGMKLLLH